MILKKKQESKVEKTVTPSVTFNQPVSIKINGKLFEGTTFEGDQNLIDELKRIALESYGIEAI